MAVPEKIPTVFLDRLLAAFDSSGAGKFVIQMELEFEFTLDSDRLAMACDLVLDAEPVLGCRMVNDPKLPYWQRLSPLERKNFFVASSEEEYLPFRHRAIDFQVGPQFQACLFRRSSGDRLLLKVAHQVSDTGGVKDVAAKMSAIYNQLGKDSGFRPAPNLSGCRDFSQIMDRLPFWAYPIIFFNFLRQMWANTIPAATHHLPIPSGPLEPLTYVVKTVPSERVARIAEYGKAHNATLNDLVVAAHYWALVKEANWDRRSMLRLQTTVDLRRWYLPEEKAQGICNLSTYEYPNLGRHLGRDFAETVELVGCRTRARKQNYIGLTEVCMGPVLKLLSFNSLAKFGRRLVTQLDKSKTFPNALTNMGEIKPDRVNFSGEPIAARLLPPFVFPPLFGGGLSSYKGELTLCAGVPDHIAPIIGRFYDRVLDQLPI